MEWADKQKRRRRRHHFLMGGGGGGHNHLQMHKKQYISSGINSSEINTLNGKLAAYRTVLLHLRSEGFDTLWHGANPCLIKRKYLLLSPSYFLARPDLHPFSVQSEACIGFHIHYSWVEFIDLFLLPIQEWGLSGIYWLMCHVGDWSSTYFFGEECWQVLSG